MFNYFTYEYFLSSTYGWKSYFLHIQTILLTNNTAVLPPKSFTENLTHHNRKWLTLPSTIYIYNFQNSNSNSNSNISRETKLAFIYQWPFLLYRLSGSVVRVLSCMWYWDTAVSKFPGFETLSGGNFLLHTFVHNTHWRRFYGRKSFEKSSITP